MHPPWKQRRQPLAVIGDVHGMTDALRERLAEAREAGAFPVLLGDLIDKGPDSLGVLRLVLPAIERGEMALVRGNHDERLLRDMARGEIGRNPVATEIQSAPDAARLAALILSVISTSPFWISLPGYLLVHGAFHPAMPTYPSDGSGGTVPAKLRALALFGETTGRLNVHGYPERTHRWVATIPAKLTVVVGHDTRQIDKPLVVTNAAGGQAIFLDTGAAKGGRLSSLLIPPL